MFCKNCGKEVDGSKKFCTGCGTPLAGSSTQNAQTTTPPPVRPPMPSEPWTTKKALKALAGIVVVGIIIFYKIQNAADSTAVDKNNTALSAVDSGNDTQAISDLQDASSNAATNDTKITTLKNLAYVYETNGKNDQALASFQEALNITSPNSFNYYLISAEIALLQSNPNSAYINFNKALKLEPDNYQVNNSLAIFYMNLDGSSADYEDYGKALTYALKANSLSNSLTAKENLGIAYFWNDQYDQSISLLSPISITQHPYVGFWLGYDYVAKKDVANAKYYFQQAINAGGIPPKIVTDYLNSH